MYGTLGYIGAGDRRAPVRNASFLGTSGHPARKEFYGARRPTDEAAPPPGAAIAPSNTVALLERRCAFLEEQEKRRGAEIADLRARLNDSHAETIRGTVMHKTEQVVEMGDKPKAVPVGTSVQLQYPMRRVQVKDATQVWMRRREVDPHVASVSYTWLLLFSEHVDGSDRVYVGGFE